MDREAPALAWRAEGLWQPCATLIGPGTPRISLPVRQTAAWQAARLEQLFPPIAGQPTTLPPALLTSPGPRPLPRSAASLQHDRQASLART